MMLLPRRDPVWLGFVIVVTAAAVFTATGLPARFDLQWLDWQFQWLAKSISPTGADDIVVVGIDDASLKEFGVPVATLHRPIGQFLEAMSTARARAVGVDVVLPETSYDRVQPGLDAALARGILKLKPVAPLVLGIGAGPDARARPLQPLFDRLPGPEGQGLALVQKDPDGVIRRFDERIGVDSQSVPTFAGQLARSIGTKVTAGIIPMFDGPRFRYLPLNEVLAWGASQDIHHLQRVFSGRVVLLGSLLAFDDQHLVPVPFATSDTGNTTHGVFIHAMQLRGLMAGNLIQEIPKSIGMLVPILLTIGWWLRPGKGSWLGIGTTVVAILILSPTLLRAGWAIPAVTWSMALLAGVGGRTALAAWQAASERRRLRLAFDGVVSPDVLKEILAGRLHPSSAGERREICVLFSDIRNFTQLSEHLPPEVVTDFLNRYFEHMARAIHRHGGTVDKFIGDGIMAFFGAPMIGEDPCGGAYRSAREMLTEVGVFNREQEARGGPQIAIGVGLHFGPALVGYIGSSDRHAYSAVGDTVNTASRLEGLTKELGYPIVMSSAVQDALTEMAGIESLGVHPVKGRAPIEVFGWKP